MATAETTPETCLVCLEAPAVRTADTCQHSYCENCLSRPDFACPQCVVRESPGGDGTDSAERANTDAVAGEAGLLQSGTGIPQNPAAGNETCKICHCRGVTVQAAMKCKECRNISLCKSCSQAHQKSTATKHHVLTPLQRGEVSVLCDEHEELAELFCTPCSKTCCHLCVTLNHSDHEIQSINSAVFLEFDAVRSQMEYQKEWLKMLKSDEKELHKSKATAQEMEDGLIKSIEDHAEKCIEEILKNKEALKKQVRANFEVVTVMEKHLEEMPELQRASGNVVAKANSLLNEQAELNLTYIEKLVALKQQLDKLKEDHPAYKKDKAKCQRSFKNLREKAIVFHPRVPTCKIGGFEDRGPKCSAGGPCVCESCEKEFNWPDAAMGVECRHSGTCTCGTCGCVFDRKQLKDDGSCVGDSLCPGQPRSELCVFCKDKGSGSSMCNKRKPCNIQIAVRNFIP